MKKRSLAVLLAAALTAALFPVTILGEELPAENPADLFAFDWPEEIEEDLPEESEPAPLNGIMNIEEATCTGLKEIYRVDIVNMASSGGSHPTIDGVSLDTYKPKIKLYFGDKLLTEGTDYELGTNNSIGPGYVRFKISGKGAFSGTKYVTAQAATGVTIAGKNRYATNAELIKTCFMIGPGSEKDFTRIVVVTGEEFPDALAANAYAGIHNNPPVLSKRASLPKDTADLIKLVQSDIKEVVVIGGKMDGAIKDLKKLLPTASFKTIAGNNRYQTADAVTRQFLLEMYGVPLNNNTTKVDCPVFVTTGQSPADALSASGWSYSLKIPVLLVQDGTFNKKSDTKNVLKHFKYVVLLGDEKVTKDSIVPSDATKIRIGGKNRWETSRKISDTYRNLIEGAPMPLTLYVPSDDSLFPDALSAGQLASPNSIYGCAVILVNEKHPAPYSIAYMNPNYDGMPPEYIYVYSMFVGSAGKDKGKIYDAVMKNIEAAMLIKV